MPMPLHQPLALLELCCRKSGSLLYQACCCIERVHGAYNRQVCARAVSRLQRYLLDMLVSLLDDVGERAVRRHLWLNTLHDSRILYALLIYKSTESLTVLTEHPDSHVFDCFICTNLLQLTNLVHLDLSGIECSNTKLESIGNTCYKLKYLVLNMPDKDRSYMVSSSGFACLGNLENLCVLKDSSGKQFENITRVVILELLRVLKNLKELDYCSLGEIVDNYVGLTDFKGRSKDLKEIKPLALTCIKVDTYFSVKPRTDGVLATSDGPSPNIIFSLARACPNLAHLELLSFDMCSDTTRDLFVANLANSSMRLTTLALDGFSVNDEFEKLLKTKGANLRTFMFSPLHASRRHLELIAQWCPNVPNLKFTKSCIADVYGDECGPSKRVFSITGGI